MNDFEKRQAELVAGVAAKTSEQLINEGLGALLAAYATGSAKTSDYNRAYVKRILEVQKARALARAD